MIDVLIVGAFVAFSLWGGLRARRASRPDLGGYFLADRSLGAWRSGLSMTATQYAADTPLLAAGLVATGGVFALWRLWSYGIAFLLLGFLLGGCWWRSRVVTDAELCELRYDGRAALWLRGLKAVYYGLVFNCAVLAMVLAAAVRVAEPFLVWHDWLPPGFFAALQAWVEWVGVPLCSDPGGPDVWRDTTSNLISVAALYAFTLAYSTTGGLRGVVTTDLGQLAVLGAGTALYAGIAVHAAGGLGGLAGGLAEQVGQARARALLAFDPWQAPGVGAAALAVVGLQWLVQMNSDGTGYLAQRCLACRDAVQARRAPVIFAFAQVLGRSLLWLPLLVALLLLYPLGGEADAAQRELAFVRGMQDLLPPGARGLLLAGMLAALASTVDTHLNWGASYVANDLYGRLFCRGLRRRPPRPRELLLVARLAGPALVALSLLVMTRLDSIAEAWQLTLLLGAGLGVPLLLRWTWWRANAWGELAAIGASLLAAPALLFGLEDEGVRLLAVALIAGTAAVVASLLTAPVAAEHLAAFERRVQPPGFWPDPAARGRLTRALRATGAASVSLFASLSALGGALLGSPAPFEIPAAFWHAGLLALALAAVPVWWRELS